MPKKNLNLHLFTDSFGHYIDLFIDRLEQVTSEKNVYVNYHGVDGFRNQDSIISLHQKESNLNQILTQFDQIDKVFFHPLNDFHLEFILKLKEKYSSVKLYWIIWSKEVHVNSLTEKTLYDAFSNTYIQNKYGRKNKLGRFFKETAKKVYYKLFPKSLPFGNFLECTKHIDFIGTLFEEEYIDIIKITGTRAKYIKFTYSDLSIFNDSINDVHENQNKILVNHSSDPLMNHYEILVGLSQNNIQDEVLIPLSYGDPLYGKELKREVARLNLTTQFIEEKLSFEEYRKLLLNVKCAFFNVKIQQALGNIFMLILSGAKVYLREESPVFKGLINNKIKVFPIPKLGDQIDVSPLSENESITNRKMLIELIGENAVKSYYTKIFK